MTDKTKFRPVTGKDETIQNAPKNPGWVYFASDTGKIYFDLDMDTRVAMGGSGVALLYGNAGTIDPDEYSLYHLSFDDLEEELTPKEGDLILNRDGVFYRVQEVNDVERTMACTIMSVSGGGGGGGGSNFAKKIGITLKSLATSNLLNGQTCEVFFTANSGIDVDGSIMDDRLTVNWSLAERIGTATSEYANGIIDVANGVEASFEFGTRLRHNATSVLTMWAQGINSGESTRKPITVQTSELTLTPSANFSALTRYTPDKVLLQCNAIGSMDKVLKFYFDGSLVERRVLTAQSENFQSYQVDRALATHGSHTCRIELFQGIRTGNIVDDGLAVPALEFEIGVFEVGNTTPVIWLGEYQKTYYNYDNIQIPFLAYDPANSNQIVVTLKKNGIELPSSPRTIDTTKIEKWNLFEITDAEMTRQNRYSISCGDVERSITFNVVQDPTRTMEYVKPESLFLQFDAKGRSNSESIVNRQTLEFEKAGIKAEFKDFNWYNNGWILDEDNQTCLRISNGAEFSLPIGQMVFNNSTIGEDSNSIELQFKVRNVQDYSNLIKNVTRYSGDDDFYEAFMNQTAYDNYDAFLQYWLPLYPVEKEEDRVQYDSLEFSRVQKNITLDKAVCKYYSGDNSGATGLCLGPQDAFFSNGTDTVSVNYVENKMVYLTMVFSKSSQLMYIYINGVITGVIKASSADPFTIESDKLVFNSNFCDIDLYKLRIYNTDLNVNDVVTNHSVDKKDVLIYDQNKLAVENDAINEFQFKFEEMIKYNEAHPEAPLMPYIVYSTELTGDDRLPWSKKTEIAAKIEFVNTGLDAAFASGELLDLAIKDGLCTATSDAATKEAAVKTYYKHHCPSWTGDYCELVVQGTSSEFYPRRNYKIKLKTDYHPNANEKKLYHILLNKGPFAQEYLDDQAKLAAGEIQYGKESTRQKGWYMDNYTNATDRWTMKVDYMESSGSYNAGFASLVGTAYSKHPLQDYIKAGAFAGTDSMITDVIPGNSDIRWDDYRTSLKGFPVLAFHKKSDGSYLYVGMYRMLLDKGSDDVLGFNLPEEVTGNFLDGEEMSKMAECWEFCNNARGFCSYRDPWNRVELSFKAPKGESNEFTSAGAPIITDNIEYRYNTNEDYIDILLNLIDKDGKVAVTPENNAKIKAEFGDEYDVIANPDKGRELIYKFYKNWEDVNKWVWSTNTENVVAEGFYQIAPVGDVQYAPGTYYVYDEEQNAYVKEADDSVWDRNTDYFEQHEDENDEGETVISYAKVFATTGIYLWSESTSPGMFYSENDGAYTTINSKTFDSEIDYYELVIDESYKDNADRLVEICNDEAYDASKEYYTYDGSVKVGTRATVKVDAATAEANYAPGKYYVPKKVKYGIREYEYDTQEYRAAKFVNELTDHFDPEYLATYFIMTEVFECYDSRGKNCMMASWGPLKAGGNYIWYPIFYDIDTQLGINNTGIPSFEYNVDATEAGNYSTSDSLLWNNFYKYFKNSYILMKYKHLRGTTVGVDWTKLKQPTLEKIENIESWYKFEESATGSLMARGVRPLIATNLDMWWKYITITNNKGIKDGSTGWLNRDGQYITDTNGTYFYALQGDRSLSRQQFLTNRIEYIDSWLNQGNYQRGGSNNIRGRVAANNPTKTSDVWVNSASTPYYNENGSKRYPFDAQYWIDLKPIRSSYVTVSDDAEAYPSQKYDGINPVKFEITAIQNGVMNSANYPEQLLYVYGMNKMADLGEMHNLYWQEFDLTGDATHLTTLKLGYDGVEIDPDTGEEITWRNDKINQPSIPGSKDDTFGGMPLLKEVNLCNLQVSTGSPTLDFSSCEKLQNFRATGSNFVAFNFAEGVALHTLYLPSSLTRLELTEANLLTNLITEYEAPRRDEFGTLVAPRGLYLQGMFEENATAINTLNFRGGNLGYDGYKLLNKYFEIRDKQATTSKIQMTNVNWCPYVQLVEGDEYDPNAEYYRDNGHYGFTPYTSVDYDEYKFDIDVLNGELYRKDTSIPTADIAQIKDIEMLKKFINENKYQGIAGNVPNLTGIIYVDNSGEDDAAVDELYIRNTLVKNFPQLTFFFAKVAKANTAKFIIMEENGLYEYVANINPQNTELSVQKVANGSWFGNPYELYNPLKDNYDFHGWSTTNSTEGLIASADATKAEKEAAWEALSLEEGKTDYVFYAVFTIHEWRVNFWAGPNKNQLTSVDSYSIVHGYDLYETNKIPSIPEDSLGDTERYRFLGWSQSDTNLIVDNAANAKLANISTMVASEDVDFYAVFTKESVYDSATDLKYFDIQQTTYIDQYSQEVLTGYVLSPIVTLSGKITIPTEYENTSKGWAKGPILQVGGFKGSSITHVYWYGDPKVVEILQNGFAECTKLKVFEMPKTMRKLSGSAFNSCSKLTPPNIGDTQIHTIANYVFQGAFEIKETIPVYTFPATLKTLGNNTFAYFINISGGSGPAIQTINFGKPGAPSSLTSIGTTPFVQNERAFGDVNVYVSGGTPDPSLQAMVNGAFASSISGTVSYPSA